MINKERMDNFLTIKEVYRIIEDFSLILKRASEDKDIAKFRITMNTMKFWFENYNEFNLISKRKDD